MFTNKLINGIHATRYIMSWVRMGGELGYCGEGVNDFREWLRSLNLEEDDIDYIVRLAQNGKLELENSVHQFMRKQ